MKKAWGRFQVEKRREGREPTLKWWAVALTASFGPGTPAPAPPAKGNELFLSMPTCSSSSCRHWGYS